MILGQLWLLSDTQVAPTVWIRWVKGLVDTWSRMERDRARFHTGRDFKPREIAEQHAIESARIVSFWNFPRTMLRPLLTTGPLNSGKRKQGKVGELLSRIKVTSRCVTGASYGAAWA